ncbi:MAG: hypothetical protein SGJ11_08360 [Phycisphaerae bacterium]|nr:hypothetical protein [Phycisphaerae bacterium]
MMHSTFILQPDEVDQHPNEADSREERLERPIARRERAAHTKIGPLLLGAFTVGAFVLGGIAYRRCVDNSRVPQRRR